MPIMKGEKAKKDGKNRSSKSRENQNAQRKGNLQIFGNIGSGHHQTSGDERENLQRIHKDNVKTTRNQTT